MKYAGWRVQDRDALLAALARDGVSPRFSDLRLDHVTYRYLWSEPPPPASALVVGRAEGDGVEALVVEVNGKTTRVDGGVYHITYSLDPGHRGVESNELVAKGSWDSIGPYPIDVRPFVEESS